MKIIIEVESGMVTGVYASEPVTVEVRDMDALECGDNWQTFMQSECLEASDENWDEKRQEWCRTHNVNTGELL